MSSADWLSYFPVLIVLFSSFYLLFAICGNKPQISFSNTPYKHDKIPLNSEGGHGSTNLSEIYIHKLITTMYTKSQTWKYDPNPFHAFLVK